MYNMEMDTHQTKMRELTNKIANEKCKLNQEIDKFVQLLIDKGKLDKFKKILNERLAQMHNSNSDSDSE